MTALKIKLIVVVLTFASFCLAGEEKPCSEIQTIRPTWFKN